MGIRTSNINYYQSYSRNASYFHFENWKQCPACFMRGLLAIGKYYDLGQILFQASSNELMMHLGGIFWKDALRILKYWNFIKQLQLLVNTIDPGEELRALVGWNLFISGTNWERQLASDLPSSRNISGVSLKFNSILSIFWNQNTRRSP